MILLLVIFLHIKVPWLDIYFLQVIEPIQVIEPKWYCPIIPMVLVNGGEGIGSGYYTTVPSL